MTPISQAVILFLLCKSLATFREVFAVFKSYLFLHLFFSSAHLNVAVLISSAVVSVVLTHWCFPVGYLSSLSHCFYLYKRLFN